MRVVVTGGTGFVGSRLIPRLFEAGHEVIVLTRDAEAAKKELSAHVEVRATNLYDADSVREGLEGAEAVVHLAGANLSAKRWTGSYQKVIRESRIVPTNLIVDAMKEMGDDRPGVFISSSAIGWYGPRPADHECLEDEFDATNFAPRDFLMVTLWRDVEALRAFAGEAWDTPVVTPDEEPLVEAMFADHYQRFDASPDPSGSESQNMVLSFFDSAGMR